jgi:hypothetical protein
VPVGPAVWRFAPRRDGQLAPAGRGLLIAAAVIVEVFATLQYRVARSIAAEVGR